MKGQTTAFIIALVVIGGTIPLTASGFATHADRTSWTVAAQEETTTEGENENGSESGVTVGEMEIPNLRLQNVTVLNASVDRLVIVNESTGGELTNTTRTNVSLDRVHAENVTLEIDLQDVTIRNESLAIDLLSSTAGNRTDLVPRKNATVANRTLEGVEIGELVVRTVSPENVTNEVTFGRTMEGVTTANVSMDEPPVLEIGTGTIESANATANVTAEGGNETEVRSIR